MNIIDYVQSNNRTFAEEPFNNLDALVLSQLVYCCFENIVNGEKFRLRAQKLTIRDFYKAEYFDDLFSVTFTADNDKILLSSVAASPRFRDLRVRHAEESINPQLSEQFAVCIFEISKDTDFIAFRGTDSTMIGWKEDLNLSFMDEVPSQKAAVNVINVFYKEKFSPARNLIIGGHSKGGNLAVYGASFADKSVRKKINRVYSFDGPGFRDEVQGKINQENNTFEIIKIVPKKSLVGMLMESGDNFRIVESDAFLLLQHAAYSWQIDGNDFRYVDQISKESIFVNKTVRAWLMRASDEDREIFINALFEILDDNQIENMTDFASVNIRELLSSRNDLSEEQEDVIKKLLSQLVFSGFKQKGIDIRNNIMNRFDSITDTISE